MRETLKILTDIIRQRLKSRNNIPVERINLSRQEAECLLAEIERLECEVKGWKEDD